jgi:pimeloyl-ACP methyl ester carboxylesterase
MSKRCIHPERADQGLTIVLPGIMGAGVLEDGIVRGLDRGGTPTAIELYDWTYGPLMMVYNLRAIDHNRREAEVIANKIVAYQDRYPGRPVNVVGYSGGGAEAVFVLEALPPGRNVTTAVLLAPTLSPNYDLQLAASHVQNGLRSFHSELDIPVLGVLVTAVGNSDGSHMPAAGVLGFNGAEDAAYSPPGTAAVAQRAYDFDMLEQGHAGGHFGWRSPGFVATHVAPLLHTEAADQSSWNAAQVAWYASQRGSMR